MFTVLDKYVDTFDDNLKIIERNIRIVEKLKKRDYSNLFKEDIFYINPEDNINWKNCDMVVFKRSINDIVVKTYHETHKNINILKYSIVSNIRKENPRDFTKNVFKTYREKFIEEIDNNYRFKKYIEYLYLCEIVYSYNLLNNACESVLEFDYESLKKHYKKKLCFKII